MGIFHAQLTTTILVIFSTKILVVFCVNEAITPEVARELAEKTLDSIFHSRHDFSIDPSMVARVDGVRENVINAMREDVNNMRAQKNEGKLSIRLKKELEVKEQKLKTFESLTTEKYLKILEGKLRAEKNTDTISILLSGDDLYVSGNIKTRRIDNLIDNPEVFKAVALKPKNQIQFDYEDFGLHEGDASVINRALKTGTTEVPEISGKVSNVYMVHPVRSAEVEMEYKGLLEAEKTKIIRQMEDDVKAVKRKYAKEGNAGGLETELERIKVDADIKMQKAQMMFDSKLNAFYHAEMVQIASAKTALSGGGSEDAVLGTSKSFCIKCKLEVDKYGKFRYVDDGKGNMDPKNWGIPEEVKITKVPKDSPDVAKPASASASSSSSNPDALSGTRCSRRARRRKRAAKSSCIFFTSGSNEPGILKGVQEIDSEAFMQKYKDGSPNVKSQLSSAAESSKAKLLGEKADTVLRIIKHERMTKHEGTLKSSRDNLASGMILDADIKEGVRLSPKRVQRTLGERISIAKKSGKASLPNKIKLGKGLTSFTRRAGKVSGTLGNFLLAKNVVRGIANNDTTGLAIIGGRVGGEIALGSGGKLLQKSASYLARKAGTKLGVKATAKAASKTFGFLSKAAGPIGAVADVGLSIWSITTSAIRLSDKNATKWEQNEAIADIVADSLDMGITIAVTVGSLAFPPLAPLFAVVGFFLSLFVTAAVAVYKANNHVDMLNSKVPLLDFERKNEVDRHLMGRETSEYIINLIETKNANNIAVNDSIAFLDNNDDYIGHVFPSKTMTPEGRCWLEKTHCKFTIKLPATKVSCLTWESTRVISWNCTKNAECLSGATDKICGSRDYVLAPGSNLGHDMYACKCQPDNYHFGDDIPNQTVDFRSKAQVFVDRASPDPPYNYKYEFLCQPSSKTSKGYRVSKPKPETAFLCDGAIGLQRKTRGGKYMLYDLREGTDVVHLNRQDQTHNRFLIGNGNKTFYGSGGTDEFILSDTTYLRGLLDGGQGENTLVLGDTCFADEKLTLDMESGRLTGSKKVDVGLKSITKVYGRADRGEDVIATCATSLIAGNGGSQRDVDNVSLRGSCNTSLTIVAGSFTTIDAKDIGREAIVFVPNNTHTVYLGGKMESANDTKGSCRVTLQIQSSAQQLRTSAPVTLKPTIRLDFNLITNINIDMSDRVDILLQEDEGETPTQVFVDWGQKTPSLTCIHRLNSPTANVSFRRFGCPFEKNAFFIAVGNVDAIGGNNDDTFVVAEGDNVGRAALHGEEGTDGVHLSPSIQTNEVSVDLIEGWIKLGEANIRVTGVEHVHGIPEKSELYRVGCSTMFVNGNGGESKANPDRILVQNEVANRNTTVCSLNLTVESTGHTHILSSSDKGVLNIFVTEKQSISTQVEAVVSSTQEVLINLPFQVSSAILRRIKGNKVVVEKAGGNGSHVLETNLKLSQESTSALSSPFIPNFQISFQEQFGIPSATLLVQSSDDGMHVFHEITSLANEPTAYREGINDLPNYFRVVGGQTSWELKGGEKDDVFDLNTLFAGEIIGGGGVNDIILTNSVANIGAVKIDLVNGVITDSSNSTKLSFGGIQRVFGAPEQKEIFLVNCHTQLIVASAMNDTVEDVVEFGETKSCHDSQTHVVAEGHVSIYANEGNQPFTVQVQPTSEGSLRFQLSSILKRSVKQVVLLHIHPKNLTNCTFEGDENGKSYSVILNFGDLLNSSVNLSLSVEKPSGRGVLDIDIMFINPKFAKLSSTFLFLDEGDGEPTALHEVDAGKSSGSVEGAPGVKNVFQLRSGSNVSVNGGWMGDVFHLFGANFTGTLRGNSLSTNTLALTSDKEHLIVDFQNGMVTTKNGTGVVSIFGGIQAFEGLQGKSETVFVGCTTKKVRPRGGASIVDFDKINVRKHLACNKTQPDAIIFVEGYTRVSNLYELEGSFTYVLFSEKDWEINTVSPSSGKAEHTYRFQFWLDRISATQFIQERNLLKLFFKSGKVLEFEMGSLNTPEFLENPRLTLEKNNDRVDISVQRDGAILTSILVNGGGSEKEVTGIPGAHNDFMVSLKENGEGVKRLAGLQGSNMDDSFRLVSVDEIGWIDGSGGTNNQLSLSSNIWHGDDGLLIDLRSNNGSITSQSSNVTYVRVLKNIQILSGRGSAQNDTVYIDCKAVQISGVRRVVVSQTTVCNDDDDPQAVTVIEVDELTEVFFETLEDDPFAIFAGTTFHYKFNTLRFFSVQTEFWFRIRNTTQVFHLAFALHQLESIHFDLEEGRILYEIQGNVYSHDVDTYKDWDQEFLESPKLQTADGYQIKIGRDGEIFGVKSVPGWSPEEDDSVVAKYGKMANDLKITFLIDGGSGESFIYAGHSETTNVLTNRESRSLLYGAGAKSTAYFITGLEESVKIYAGFADDEEKNEEKLVHLLDLTHVVLSIRESSHNYTKYVPKVIQRGADLHIVMDSFQHIFPGEVILVDGVEYSSQIHVLLDVTMMRITKDLKLETVEETGAKKRSRVSRSAQRTATLERKWRLSPEPFVMSEEYPEAVLSMEDFEEGQRIIFMETANGTDVLPIAGVDVSTPPFKSFRSGNELILSTVSPEGNQFRSLVILDAVDNESPTAIRSIAQTILVTASDNESTLTPLSGLVEKTTKSGVPDWEDYLEETENVLLEDIPEVPRKFQIPFQRKMWKKYGKEIVMLVVSALFLVLVVAGFTIYKFFRTWRYTLIIARKERTQIRKDRTKTNPKEAKDQMELLKLETSKGDPAQLTRLISEGISEATDVDEMVEMAQSYSINHNCSKQDLISSIWRGIISAQGSNCLQSPSDLMILKKYVKLLGAFVQSSEAEDILISKIREYFTSEARETSDESTFEDVIMMFQRAGILSTDADVSTSK